MEVAARPAVSGRTRFAAGVFAVFTALIAATALQSAILGAVLGRDFPVGRSIRVSALNWYAWAVLTPVIALLVKRFPFTKERRLRQLYGDRSRLTLTRGGGRPRGRPGDAVARGAAARALGGT